MITQKELKDYLHYNKDTGIFTRNKDGKILGWDKDGYLCFDINRKKYRAHRVAWFYTYGYWPIQVDHLDHVRSNNKLVNLREVTHQENHMNLPRRITNKSGITGVAWDKRECKWRAHMMINYKQVLSKHFTDFFEACCSRKSAERKHNFHMNHGV